MTRKRERNKTKRCGYCNKLYDAARSDSKTCGPRCHKALWRKKQRLMEKHDKILFYLQDLIIALDDPVLAPGAYKFIHLIHSTVREVVIEAGDSEFGRQIALKEIAA